MTFEKYKQIQLRTESSKDHTTERRLDHGTDGLVTEAGECKDILKRVKWYGLPLDTGHLKEELGDILWYIALVCNVLDCSLEELMDMNVEKLTIRYPEKFSADAAANRDLDKERNIFQ